MRWNPLAALPSAIVPAVVLLAVSLAPALGQAALFRRPAPEVEAGRAALQAQDATAALRHFDRALADRPDAPRLHVNRGLALQALGQVAEAEAAFLQALSLGGEASEAHHALGHLLAETGEAGRAMAHFRHALEIDPDDEAARLNLEALLRRQQREPGEQESGEQESGEQESGEQESGEQESGEQEPGEQEPGEQESGEQESGEQEPGGQAQPGQEAGAEATETERILDALQQREKGLQLWHHGQQKGKVRDGDRDW